MKNRKLTLQAIKAARKRGQIDLYLYPWLRADRSLYADSRKADLTTQAPAPTQTPAQAPAQTQVPGKIQSETQTRAQTGDRTAAQDTHHPPRAAGGRLSPSALFSPSTWSSRSSRLSRARPPARAAGRLSPPAIPPRHEERKNILVQRFDAVGDFLLTFHLKSLVEQATGARPADIYFVFDTARQAWAEILFPDWTLVPRSKRKIERNPFYRRKYLLFLRGLHIKTAIFLRQTHDPRFEDLIALAAQPENLVLPGASSSRRYFRNYFFLRTYLDYMPRADTRPPSLLSPFSFEQAFPSAFTLLEPWYCLSRFYGSKLPLRLARLPPVPAAPSVVSGLQSGPRQPQEVILHTGGSRKDKWWPLTNWVLLGRKLSESGFLPVFSFGPNEEAAGLNHLIPTCVASLTHPYAYGVMLSLPPRDLIARVQKAAMVVSIDTSMVHLGVICGTKVFILSTWEPESFFPLVPVGEFIPYPRVFGDNLMRIHFDSVRNFRMHNPLRVDGIFQEALAYLRDPRPPTFA